VAQGHELLVDQRLDRAGVDRPPALGEGLEVQCGGHERFARPRGGVEDDVPVLEQLEDGRFLGRVELEPPALGVFEKTSEQRVIADVLVARDEVVKCRGHGRGLYRPAGQGRRTNRAEPAPALLLLDRDLVKAG
jgi:hypothetical protein